MVCPEDCSPCESEEWPTVPPTFQELIDLRASQMETSHNRASLRDRLKIFKGSIAGGWKKSKPINASSLGTHPVGQPTCFPLPRNGVVNQSWGPSIRRNIKSMTSSLRGNRSSMETSEDSSTSADTHAEPKRFDSRRVATIGCSRGRLMPVDRSRSHLRRSSLSTVDDIWSRIGSAPKLPGLDQSIGLLDALNDTGLFPPLVCSLSSQPVSGTPVQDTVVEASQEITHGKSVHISTTQSFRAPRLDLSSFHRCRRRRQMISDSKSAISLRSNRCLGQDSDSDISSSSNRCFGQDSDKEQQIGPEPEKIDPVNRAQQHREMNDSSRHPIEWLDFVIEKSWETRNPIDPKFDVSGEELEKLKRTETCVFVVVPKDSEFPKPRPAYSGFKAALEDVCDRFGIFYAGHAAFNCATREITLYPCDQEQPKERRIDEDTYFFDLATARRTWNNPPPPAIWQQQYRARMFHLFRIAKATEDKQVAMMVEVEARAAARKAVEAAAKEAAQIAAPDCTSDELMEGAISHLEIAFHDENQSDAKDADMASRLGF
ncbi:hypothetical protein GGR57DRAFT_509753 [Xylariaceae sp. FL1272]|nr:hypothetical protein GGR57DRAFT_509753 [Xylariaceae sp. FL1272]